MSLIQSLIYGLVSGITEFLPVSSRAHQALMRYLFGLESRNPLQDLLVHIGLLFAILYGCRDILQRLMLQQKSLSSSRRKVRQIDSKSIYELRLLKTAIFPLFIGLLLMFSTTDMEQNLLALVGFLLLNACILLIADHSSRGNRDARTMTGLDGIIMGFLGALSAFPGISRTGIICSYAVMRGAEGQNSVDWSILLGIPALVFTIIFDVISMFSLGITVSSFVAFLGYLMAGISSFVAGILGISLFRLAVNRSGFAGVAYYSIGAALFSFTIYLIT